MGKLDRQGGEGGREMRCEKHVCVIPVLIVDAISQCNMVNSTGMNKTGAK